MDAVGRGVPAQCAGSEGIDAEMGAQGLECPGAAQKDVGQTRAGAGDTMGY